MDLLVKKLSIITVSFNASEELMQTIQSVNNQLRRAEVEHIIVDGNSTDTTPQILQEHFNEIEIIVSEPDRGVYDAMNKGISLAKSEWIYFLNAGDTFLNEHSVTRILDAQNNSDVLYSDVIVNTVKETFTFHTSFENKKLNHQGFVYKKHLHKKFGIYSVIKKFTAADYLFFLQLDDVNVKKLEHPIAIFQAGGLSSTVNAVHQKFCLDFLSGRISSSYLAAILLFYPLYRRCKTFMFKVFR